MMGDYFGVVASSYWLVVVHVVGGVTGFVVFDVQTWVN